MIQSYWQRQMKRETGLTISTIKGDSTKRDGKGNIQSRVTTSNGKLSCAQDDRNVIKISKLTLKRRESRKEGKLARGNMEN